jgi:hypothetical protein
MAALPEPESQAPTMATPGQCLDAYDAEILEDRE